ncbi:hypothetical protein [Streptomyces purpurascens]|uniref:Uncharacterized protein n=1 Tax=Streptomyces purpurascens TaxID=1924 RepID=A0ABZ1MNS1_STREF|nr:hypothetical protein [Streptomyces purpurascens]MCE7047212.1 hypothetical protein [Streptomyces purpurascens]GHA40380.1 hypothetical protein GCM10010303_59470 [Streptomyces purpurascens]
MPSNHSHSVLPPVAADPGVLEHPTSDRRSAAEHRLLATLPPPSRDRARLEWQQHAVAMLPLGIDFSAVRIPGRLVLALADSTEPSELDWRPLDVECLGLGSYLGVPRADALECTRARVTYWSVPMASAATLCRPLKVARLIAAARQCLATEREA